MNEELKRISVDLPIDLINRFDVLKEEWGLRRRGAVLERLLEEIFEENDESNEIDDKKYERKEELISTNIDKENDYIEDNAIVLIRTENITEIPQPGLEEDDIPMEKENINDKNNNRLKGINLPGFVSKKTSKLKNSLGRVSSVVSNYNTIFHDIKQTDLDICTNKALNHWITLYGNKPKEEVIEAAMIWIARDIWPYLDDTQNLSFTWNAATIYMKNLCKTWKESKPSFEKIIVMAGVMEDPFAINTLKNRIPTLIRRFVNSFKRRSNVTSFQTLESTMTILGALKLLDLPTTAGKSVSLSTVREAYKLKALENHPDSGGSTDTMRKINEAYQLLKDLYKTKE